MRQTTTFRRLFEAELRRTGSSHRATSRATALFGFLTSLPTHDKVGHLTPYAPATYKRNMAALRRIGIAPVWLPSDLALVARDIGVSESDELTRLVWALNGDRARRFEHVREDRAAFVAEAERLLSQEIACDCCDEVILDNEAVPLFRTPPDGEDRDCLVCENCREHATA